MIYVGADHRGFALKKLVEVWLAKRNMEFVDCGAHAYFEQDDFPLYAADVARKVSADPEVNRGVVLCGSGVGVDVVANKEKGIRSVLALNEKQVRSARADDDVNVLSIAADYVNPEALDGLLKAFFGTEFNSHEARFKRRLDEIKNIENQ